MSAPALTVDRLTATVRLDGSDDGTADVARRVAESCGAADRPTVLDYPHQVARAGGEHLESRGHRALVTSTKRTVVPGVRSAGGSRSTSQRVSAVVPSSRQPPGEARG